MTADHKNYKKILKKFNYSFRSKEEFVADVKNIEQLAQIIYAFERRRKQIRKGVSPVSKKTVQ